MVYCGDSICPNCMGYLCYYDSVYRIVRSKRRSSKWVKIRRLKCLCCYKLHRELPDYIIPYKQYDIDVIKGVIENIITNETIGFEDYPCDMTMSRWKNTRNLHLLL